MLDNIEKKCVEKYVLDVLLTLFLKE